MSIYVVHHESIFQTAFLACPETLRYTYILERPKSRTAALIKLNIKM